MNFLIVPFFISMYGLFIGPWFAIREHTFAHVLCFGASIGLAIAFQIPVWRVIAVLYLLMVLAALYQLCLWIMRKGSEPPIF